MIKNTKITHRLILLIVGFSLIIPKSYSQEMPNIIFILVDDLGYGDVGVFYQNERKKKGLPHLVTPSLDKMAAQGAILTQNYANAPVCVSSRSSLLTGVTQGHSGIRDNQFDKALDYNYTMASTLKSIGYVTMGIGKWGLQGKAENGNWPAHPLKRGFDHFYGYIRHVDGHEHYPKEGLYRGAKEVYEDYNVVTDDLDKCYTGDLFTARAKQWIIDHTEVNGTKPFFMFLSYDTPHAVTELPTQAYPSGSGLKGGLQWLGKKGQMINTASGKIDSWISPIFDDRTYFDETTGAKVPWDVVYKRYATVVERLDAQVGDVLALLKDLKISENTLVVFTSDNGPSQESYLESHPYSPEFFKGYGPFDGIKRDLWEGGVRMPTIVQWASKIRNGLVVATPSMLSDWLATFLATTGRNAPARSDGVSLLPSLLASGKQLQSTIYIEYVNEAKTPEYKDFEKVRRNKQRGQMQLVRLGDYVGVRYGIQSHIDDFEIYNVVKDPKQSKNLASAMPELQQRFKDRVLQLRIPDEEAKRPYDGEMMPGLKEMPSQQGVIWKEFKGDYGWVPQTTGLEPARMGIMPKEELFNIKHSNATVITYEGILRVPDDNEYSFFISTNGKAFLRIHDASVIDADYNYRSGSEKEGKVRLKAGLHPFKLTVLQKPNDHRVALHWSSNEFSKELLGNENLY